MLLALRYLVTRFFYRIWQFLVHWYAHGFLLFWEKTLALFAHLDQAIALRITLRYFFEPLYRDYTTLGRVLGVVFRSGRVIVGVFAYGVLGIFAVALYVLWALLPLYILSHALLP